MDVPDQALHRKLQEAIGLGGERHLGHAGGRQPF
ncbi:hypothetical protein A2U01_0117647, partial [Trifolium medium]|nr:hypothetical protein [Trifolium medium]